MRRLRARADTARALGRLRGSALRVLRPVREELADGAFREVAKCLHKRGPKTGLDQPKGPSQSRQIAVKLAQTA
jgi:hypothetical protein